MDDRCGLHSQYGWGPARFLTRELSTGNRDWSFCEDGSAKCIGADRWVRGIASGKVDAEALYSRSVKG